jgi:hypothetical protein
MARALARGGRFVLCGVVFGAAVAAVKGTGGGFRYSLGNIAAPWLVIPLLAGRSRRSLSTASLLGAAVAVSSLIGFYALTSAAYDLVNSHTLRNNLLFLVVGACVGLVAGAIGYWSVPEPLIAGLAVGLALVAEPLGLLGLQQLRDATITTSFPGLKVAELVVGSAVLAACGRQASQKRRRGGRRVSRGPST